MAKPSGLARKRKCQVCPRRCLAPRTPARPGRCGAAEPPGFFRLAGWMVHNWEEPYISGTQGSGAIFFSGCPLGCVFCQNHVISQVQTGQGSGGQTLPGQVLSLQQLEKALLDLARQGVHNINLVSGGHYVDDLAVLLKKMKADGLEIPIVWNSSGYETVDSLRRLEGLIDIYLPDFKFAETDLAADLSQAADYPEIAQAAVKEMLRQQPDAVFDRSGLMKRGLAIRHLVLPGQIVNSKMVLACLAGLVPLDTPLAIMSQYTPMPALLNRLTAYPDLKRRLTTFEYRKITDAALDLGFTRLIGQARQAAQTSYTPDFSRFLRT